MKKSIISVLVLICIINISANVYAVSNSGNGDNLLIRIFFSLLCFIILLIFVYVFTKYFATKSANITGNNNIKIIDYFNLGSNNKIIITKIYQKIYILLISNNNSTVIDVIDNDIELYLDNDTKTNKFEFCLKNIIDKINIKRDVNE